MIKARQKDWNIRGTSKSLSCERTVKIFLRLMRIVAASLFRDDAVFKAMQTEKDRKHFPSETGKVRIGR